MLSTRRSRVAVGGAAMAAVVAGIGAVTFNASAAEVAAAPAPQAADARAVAPAPQGADARAVSIPFINQLIKPPAGSRPIGAFVVTNGTQNYTCGADGVFPAASTPEAQLVGTGGKIHHFAGPSWQSLRDQSLVTAGKVNDGVAKAGSIPELLLKINSHTGTGILSKADYINRLFTSGGAKPAGSCTPGQVAKVRYGAVYVFWDAPAGS
ncbi:hypothetical protein GCM10010172_73080 [Paractinoplanes ferrugineus]|uniref:Tat pathway signal sequence domain protein n=1 Tax=Paractinoplanes ferrugineus TaxID=113564 RepID=A0A919MKU1_9ACTN|nr:DUF3455 domain-containing protein [Actinoplanes ferrugineus]GIE11537.1 hypothetical protein Afe05nite_33770 [Actinoplanes ferrugineus]